MGHSSRSVEDPNTNKNADSKDPAVSFQRRTRTIPGTGLEAMVTALRHIYNERAETWKMRSFVRKEYEPA